MDDAKLIREWQKHISEWKIPSNTWQFWLCTQLLFQENKQIITLVFQGSICFS